MKDQEPRQKGKIDIDLVVVKRGTVDLNKARSVAKEKIPVPGTDIEIPKTTYDLPPEAIEFETSAPITGK